MKVKAETKAAGLKLSIQQTKIMASSSITSWQIDGEKMETVTDYIFLGSKITGDSDCSHEIKRRMLLGKKADKPREHIKKQTHHFTEKSPYSQSHGFSSSHVRMWELDHKEDWASKNWFRTVVLEKTVESTLECKKNKPAINPKGNEPWIFIERTDTEAEAPILWPPDVKGQLIGKDPDAGKDWRQEERGWQRMRWHHQFNGHDFKQTPGNGERQGSLVCCSPWGCKESDTTEQLNNNNLREFMGYATKIALKRFMVFNSYTRKRRKTLK